MTTHLYLDIDGVLNAYAALYSSPQYSAWPDYRLAVEGNKYGEVISPSMISELNRIIARPDVVPHWLTTWEERAPQFGASIGLIGSDKWEWLKTDDRNMQWGKLMSIQEHMAASAGVSRAIWIDDDIKDEPTAADWASNAGWLALAPYGAHGITPAMITQIEQYLG